MTLQEIGQAWNDLTTVWCIFGHDICEVIISRCDVSLNAFHNGWECNRLEVFVNNTTIQTHPSDLFLTHQEAENELQMRRNRPTTQDVVAASIKIGEAIGFLEFYSDENIRNIVDILRKAGEKLNGMIKYKI